MILKKVSLFFFYLIVSAQTTSCWIGSIIPGDIWDQAYGLLNMHVSGVGGNWCAAPGKARLKVKQCEVWRQPFCTFWEAVLSVSCHKLVTRKQFTIKSIVGRCNYSNLWLWLVLDTIMTPFHIWFPAKWLFLRPKQKTIKSQVIQKYSKIRTSSTDKWPILC